MSQAVLAQATWVRPLPPSSTLRAVGVGLPKFGQARMLTIDTAAATPLAAPAKKRRFGR